MIINCTRWLVRWSHIFKELSTSLMLMLLIIEGLSVKITLKGCLFIKGCLDFSLEFRCKKMVISKESLGHLMTLLVYFACILNIFSLSLCYP
jgi:hypothetical protein